MKRNASFAIIICYILIYLFAGWRVREFAWVFVLGLAVSYVFVLRRLLSLVRRPEGIRAKSAEVQVKRETEAVISIVFLVISHLYLAVLFLRLQIPEAYAVALKPEAYVTDFDLFYYTLLNFAEIGCGDIVPAHAASRGMAIAIAISSVLCLIVFVASYLEEKQNMSARLEKQDRSEGKKADTRKKNDAKS